MNIDFPYLPTAFGRAEDFDGLLNQKISGIRKYDMDEMAITSDSISIVVPVKDNQKGVNRFLQSIVDNTKPIDYPGEIIIVDNNSSTPIEITQDYPFPVSLYQCAALGPGAARNTGARHAVGDWILFTDSDCVAMSTLISGYLSPNAQCIAYSGMVRIVGNDPITRYYREQNTLIPAAVITGSGIEPAYLVTANCLVLKRAFLAIGGFNEIFTKAGGEDFDLGLRMRVAGNIRYNWNSVAQHEFTDGMEGFVKRFIRYGYGDKLIEEVYGLDDGFMAPEKGSLNRHTRPNIFLSKTWETAMWWGYNKKPAADFPVEDVVKRWEKYVTE